MLIYAVTKNDETNETKAYLTTYGVLHALTFPPLVNVECIIEFTIHGKTYAEKKNNLREIAIDYSNNRADGLYMSDFIAIENWFFKNGKKYGLIKEFKENAIC